MDKRYVVKPARNPEPGKQFAVVEEFVYDSGQSRQGDEVEWASTRTTAQKKADRLNDTV